MSKAILILDEMPSRCEECPCYQAEMNYETIEYRYCGVDGHVVSWNDSPKYDSCPLKPLSKEREAFGILNDYERGKILGFNSCLRMILGDKQ